MDKPWLTIIGINEDGLNGLSDASRKAIEDASMVFGGKRHLDLAKCDDKGEAWPVPFSIEKLLLHRGKKVVMLVSGDPFWYGAGATVAKEIEPGEWISIPATSTFSLAANKLGWGLHEARCLGLHAQPLETLYPLLSKDERFICLLRDGKAVAELADWLVKVRFGTSEFHVLERLGGPNEKIITVLARDCVTREFNAPVAVAFVAKGGVALPGSNGLDDSFFDNDGQITKRPVRALTLSALCPRNGEVLWDIGSGSGSISVEWLLSSQASKSFALEQNDDRAENIRRNASKFGLQKRLIVKNLVAPKGLSELEAPDTVFVGGGFNQNLFDALWKTIPEATRLVVNAVTLESQSLLASLYNLHGGSLMRFDISKAESLGKMHSWEAARTIVQWNIMK